MKLSERIRDFRTDRPSEFQMDDFARDAEKLEQQLQARDELLKSFIKSFALCDHMGDVSTEVESLLAHLGWEYEWDDFEELAIALEDEGVMYLFEVSISKRKALQEGEN